MRVTIIGSFAAVVMALSVPNLAHAGFGRRGSADSDSGNHGGGGSSGRSSSSRSDVHVDWGSSSASTSRGSRREERSEPRRDHWGDPNFRPGGRRADWNWGRDYHVWGYSFGYVPPPLAAERIVVDAEQPTEELDYERPRTHIATALAGETMFGPRGYLVGTQLSWEGKRLGFTCGYTAAFAPIADTSEYDTIHLPYARVTFALWSGERGRLRVEAGFHAAVAPEVTFVAPGLGLSGVIGLAGPVGLEARVFGNFWPYTQLDARAGVALGTGALGISFGLRALYLNDQGVLGAVNAGDTSDSFYGPYVNIAFGL